MRTDSRNTSLAMLILASAFIAMAGCDSSEPPEVLVPATEVEVGAPQDHVAVSEGYTLRANAIKSSTLPPKMLAQYGIESGADSGVLNLVVMQQGPDGLDVTVAADVTARQSKLTGQFREIEMQAITANDSTSYVGSFSTSPQEYFQFTITARPVGSDVTLLIEFEERFAELR